MVVQIQLRRDTAADWTSANPTLAAGEIGYETDTGKWKWGDGSTAWTSLSYHNKLTDAQVTLLAATSGTNTGDEASASTTVAGVVELATTAEVDTGTDNTRAVTPLGLASSALQTKVDGIEASADVTDAANVAAAGAVMADGSGDDITGDLVFTEKADHSSTPTASKGYLWVRNDTPCVLVFTDDAGTDTVLGSGGGGLADVVDDTTPQLGGSLDVNGQEITGAIDLHSTGDIIQELGDALGANKVSIRDSGGVEVAAVDSDGNITTSGTVDGRDVAADGTKLDGIESGATADQTASDIRALGFFDTSNDGTGSGLDADTVDGQEASALLARSNHTGTQALSTLAAQNTGTLVGNNTGAPASPIALTAAQARTLLNVADGATANTGALADLDTVGTTEIDDASVTLAKIQNLTGPTVIGRTTGTGVSSQLTSDQALAVALANRGAYEVIVMSGTAGLSSPVAMATNGFLGRNGSGSVVSASVGTNQVVGNTGGGIAPVDLDAAVRSAKTGRTFCVAMAEAANMSTGASGGYQYSIGNGEVGSTVGFVAPFGAECFYVALLTDAANTSTVAVRVNASSTLTSITATGAKTTSSGSLGTVSQGDIINFQTTATSGTLTGPHSIMAYFVEV